MTLNDVKYFLYFKMTITVFNPEDATSQIIIPITVFDSFIFKGVLSPIYIHAYMNQYLVGR